MKQVLWIEDQGDYQLAELTGPVYASGRYLLRLAYNATDGLSQLLRQDWSAVIVDIRIPPGETPEWKSIYEQGAPGSTDPRLGLELLKSVLKGNNAKIPLKEIPDWIQPNRFGVFTVETYRDIGNVLKELSISAYKQKTGETPKTSLLELIEQVIAQQEESNKK